MSEGDGMLVLTVLALALPVAAVFALRRCNQVTEETCTEGCFTVSGTSFNETCPDGIYGTPVMTFVDYCEL